MQSTTPDWAIALVAALVEHHIVCPCLAGELAMVPGEALDEGTAFLWYMRGRHDQKSEARALDVLPAGGQAPIRTEVR